MSVPITKPYFTAAEVEAVAEVLASGWVSQGPKVAAFEEAFGRYVGAPHAVATTSCTTALHLILIALGIKEGDEVLVPSFTFVATANAVEYCRATPVFVDIDLSTFNIDVEQIESKITSRTRAVIPVHLFGLSVEMSPLMEIARRHRLAVVEDAACAIGSRYRGQHVGTFGEASCFSFHPRKVITTGEGGMITTANDELQERCRSLRSHAATVSDLARHTGQACALPEFPEVGFNYRMTDLQAAIGLRQLEKVEELVRLRRARADRYRTAFEDLDWLRQPVEPAGLVHVFQSYVVLVDAGAPLSRDALAAVLAERGIATRQGTHAVHALDYYQQRYGLRADDCPAAWEADRRSLALPLYPQMSDEDQARVVDAVRMAADRGTRVHAR